MKMSEVYLASASVVLERTGFSFVIPNTIN